MHLRVVVSLFSFLRATHCLEGNLQRLQIRTGMTERASELQCAGSGTLPNHPQECSTELPDMLTIFSCHILGAGVRESHGWSPATASASATFAEDAFRDGD